MKFFYLLIIVFCACFCEAQYTNLKNSHLINSYPLRGISNNLQKYEGIDVQLQNLENPPHTDYDLENLRTLMEKKYPRKSNTTTAKIKRNTDTLNPLIMFDANPFNGGVPLDNDIAVSNSNIVVSVSNSQVRAYDGFTGTMIYNKTLSSIAQPIGSLASKFDPKIVYDPSTDRFILVFLIGSNSTTNKIAVCFSKTANPNDGWYVYDLPGNPLNNGSWSDYPNIGISQSDLFIAVNTFLDTATGPSGFVQTCLWQIGLQEGYNGSQLNTILYYNIMPQSFRLFNLNPVYQAGGNNSNQMYFLSLRNRSQENDSLFLFRVTHSLSSGNAQLQMGYIQTQNKYFFTKLALQPHTDSLRTNDMRILSSFIKDNTIQYVHNITDTATGNPAVYHGIINNADFFPVARGNYISDTVYNLAFPAIASLATNYADEQALITFCYSSPSHFAGFAGIYYNGTTYSEIKVLKQGVSVVNAINGNERWGDYSGIQQTFTEPCRAWAAGAYGKNSTYGTWIAQITINDSCQTIFQNINEETSTNYWNVYPNPFSDDITLEFYLNETIVNGRIDICDINGKIVYTIYESKIKSGKNRLTINSNKLSAGLYFLQIKNEQIIYATHKIIKY